MRRTARASTTIPRTAASTRSRSRARRAVRGCGWSTRRGATLPGDPIEVAAELLRAGRIVAVKGLGGYHLAAVACDEAAVAALRCAQAPRGEAVRGDGARPRRPPASWRSWTWPRSACLAGPRRPIVLLPRRHGARARRRRWRPATAQLGLMLPYTPLHHLLCAAPAACRSSSPAATCPTSRSRTTIATRSRASRPIADALPDPRSSDPRAHRRLRRARRSADARCPCAAHAATRRSRVVAVAPAPRPILACGAELKSTFCLAEGPLRVRVAPHRRPRELRHAAGVHARASSTSAACSTSTPAGRRARSASRVPLDEVRPRARRRRARRRAAPSRARRGLPGGQRRGGPGASGSPSTASASGRTARCGAASSWWPTLRELRARRRTSRRCPCPAARRPSASPGGWRPAYLAAAYGDAIPAARRSSSATGADWAAIAPACSARASRRPATSSVGPAVRRGRGDRRRARRDQLRGTGGDRARAARRADRARGIPRPAGRRTRGRSWCAATDLVRAVADDLRARRPSGGRGRALPQRPGARRRARSARRSGSGRVIARWR